MIKLSIASGTNRKGPYGVGVTAGEPAPVAEGEVEGPGERGTFCFT